MKETNIKREAMETQVKTENVLKLLIDGDLPTTISHSNADTVSYTHLTLPTTPYV